jgi:hypothetical protein
VLFYDKTDNGVEYYTEKTYPDIDVFNARKFKMEHGIGVCKNTYYKLIALNGYRAILVKNEDYQTWLKYKEGNLAQECTE